MKKIIRLMYILYGVYMLFCFGLFIINEYVFKNYAGNGILAHTEQIAQTTTVLSISDFTFYFIALIVSFVVLTITLLAIYEKVGSKILEIVIIGVTIVAICWFLAL